MRSHRRSLLACSPLVALVFVGACDSCRDRKPVVFDAGPTPVVVDAAPTLVLPIEPDAGPDASDASADAADAQARSATAVDATEARVRRCCKALRDRAKELGGAPELLVVAASCDNVAAVLKSKPGGGTPTELEPLRALLRGKPVPNVCAGL